MFNIISEFEEKIAIFYNAPFAVATDSCTHAIELALRYTNVQSAVCPKSTYVSVPMTFTKLGLNWNFVNNKWKQFYYITDDIIDAAVYWKDSSYIQNSFMCLSFQHKKHLSLGRGGAILCSNYNDYVNLKKMSYDGRCPNLPWAEQNITTMGYHYYMTPETAQLGLDKLSSAIENAPRIWSYLDYPDLSKMEIFNDKQ